jgi:ComF family protein
MWSLAGRAKVAMLDVVAPSRCAGCGRSGRVLCEGCVTAIDASPQPLIAGARAAFAYETEVRAILHRGKFRDCRAALRALSWMGGSRLDPPRHAIVSPVPLSTRRSAERGYNQAAVVAAALADFHRLPMVPLLRRTRDSPPQSTLDRSARRSNVDGAFTADLGLGAASVWLIDDVLTTGATTSAARQTLLAAGAARVDIAVLAAVP